MARPRTFDEAEVLEGAVRMFRAHGYEATSIPQLIDALGICRQSLYATFGDKHGLYLRALELWGRREVDAKLELLEGEGSPLENLRTVLRGWADLAHRCPSEGCLTAAAIIEARNDPEALAIVERQVARLEDGFRAAIDRACATGELRPTADPRRIARRLTMLAYGIGVLARLPDSGGRIADSVSLMLELLEAATPDR